MSELTKALAYELPENVIVETGTENGVEWATVQRRQRDGTPQYNGYVLLPEDSYFYQPQGHTRIFDPLEVHGGITYDRGRVIGFDTGHGGDVRPGEKSRDELASWETYWGPTEVAEEARSLARQVADFKLERTVSSDHIAAVVSETIRHLADNFDYWDAPASFYELSAVDQVIVREAMKGAVVVD